MEKHDLIGKTVTRVELAPEGERLMLFTPEGLFALVPQGDCCSHTWIESVDDFAALVGTIQAVEDLEMPDLGDLPGHDVMAYYGLKITTEKGRAVIDYRNDSNGYYGGWVEVERM